MSQKATFMFIYFLFKLLSYENCIWMLILLTHKFKKKKNYNLSFYLKYPQNAKVLNANNGKKKFSPQDEVWSEM